MLGVFVLLFLQRCSSTDVSELVGLHDLIDEAKSAKRELDAVRKKSEATSKSALELEKFMETNGLDDLSTEVAFGFETAAHSVGTYGDLVVFVQRCENASCVTNASTTDSRMLMDATSDDFAKALQQRVSELEAENAELRSSLIALGLARSETEAQCEDEVHRLSREVETHQREQTRLRESDTRKSDERARLDAELKGLKDQVEQLQRRGAYECEAVTDHDSQTPQEGSLVIVREYGGSDDRPKLTWAIAEILSHDTEKGEDRYKVRFFRDLIKSASKFALDGTFERDRRIEFVRRDAIAYVDLQPDGAGDPGKQLPLPPPEEKNDDDEDDDKTKRRKKPQPRKKPSSPSKKKSSAGLGISEVQKREIVARLSRDEAEWERRDMLAVHEQREIVKDNKIAWRRETIDGGLEFVLGIANEISNTSVVVTASSPVISADPAINETLLGERFSPENETLSVNLTHVVFVDIPNHKSKNDTWTIKSGDKKTVALVLKQAAARWWRRMTSAEERAQCPPTPPCPPAVPEETPKKKSDLSKSERSLATPEQVAAALQREHNASDVFNSTSPSRLDTLKRKLLWLVEVGELGLVTNNETQSLRNNVLTDFEDLVVDDYK